ncbi:MAG: hypothetical protein Q9226_003887 [Calogaya cf. arnoldii]
MGLTPEITLQVLRYLSKRELRRVQLVCRGLAVLAAALLDDVRSGPADPLSTDDTEQHGLKPNGPFPGSQPKLTFFSLPKEFRDMVYGFLKPPKRIHIRPPAHVQKAARRIRPWALISVSRQFRTEVRTLLYPKTPIEVYFESYEGALAYNTWIDGLHDGLEASLRHLVINDFVEINWIPDDPVSERMKRWENGLFEEDSEESDTDNQVTDVMGNWEVQWLQYESDGMNWRITGMQDMLEKMLEKREDRRGQSGTAVSGWGEDGLRDLAASFSSSGLDHWPEHYQGSTRKSTRGNMRKDMKKRNSSRPSAPSRTRTR